MGLETSMMVLLVLLINSVSLFIDILVSCIHSRQYCEAEFQTAFHRLFRLLWHGLGMVECLFLWMEVL